MIVWSHVKVCGRRLSLQPIGCTPTLSATRKKRRCSCGMRLVRHISVISLCFLISNTNNKDGTFDGKMAWCLRRSMFVVSLANVFASVLEVHFVDDETAASAVGQHLDVSGLLHRMTVVQPRDLMQTGAGYSHQSRTRGKTWNNETRNNEITTDEAESITVQTISIKKIKKPKI